MFCGKCGAELPEGAKFCKSCGAPIAQCANDVPSSDALAGMRVKSGGQASTGNGPSTGVKAAARPKTNKLAVVAICAAIALVVVAIIVLRRPTANSTTPGMLTDSTESEDYVSTDEYDVDLDESSQASQSRSFEELEAAFNSGALSESEYVAAVLDHDDVITIKDASVEQTSFGTVYFAATIVNNSNIYVPWGGWVDVSVDFSYLDEYGDKIELCAEPGKNSIGLAEHAIAEGGNPVSDAFWMRPHEERRVRIMPSGLQMRLKDGQASTSSYWLSFDYVYSGSYDITGIQIAGIQRQYSISINGFTDDASRISADNFSNLVLLPSAGYRWFEEWESGGAESNGAFQTEFAETLLGYDTSSLVVTSDNANINISGSVTITNNSIFYINSIDGLSLVYTNDKGEPLLVRPVHTDSDLQDIKLLPGDSYVVDVSDSLNMSENLYSSLNSQVDLGQIASVSVYGCDVWIDAQKSETAGLRASLLPR